VEAVGGDATSATDLSGGGGGGGRILFIGDWSQYSGRIDARGGKSTGAAGRPGTFYATQFPSSLTFRGSAALPAQVYRLADLTLPDALSVLHLRPDLSRQRSPLLIVGNLTLNLGGRLRADGEGFPGGMGTGTGMFGGAGDGSLGGGGGYGGAGGNGTGANANGGIEYGAADRPTDLGSGGAGLNGGSGGGTIQVCVTNQLALGGVISAAGESRAALGAYGGGSGGSIFVEAATISFTDPLDGGTSSRFSAVGAAGGTGAGSGGGGRIRVIVHDNSSVAGRCFVNGGSGAAGGSVQCD
jgi:hypothetical protein